MTAAAKSLGQQGRIAQFPPRGGACMIGEQTSGFAFFLFGLE